MSRMPSVGDVIDDVFRVEEELDHGNFGAVYKVTDLLEKDILALKVLKPGPHDEEELRQRFEREARLIYSLKHPHVVQVFYYGETEADLPYMAMEYLQGTDLKMLLRHHGGLSEALARRIAIESLSALHTAHQMDIVHRDLKPGNIYLVNDGSRGHVKVLDFGFAKALESENDREITNAGTLVGTPAYMSPELVHKKDVGPPADLYAMGLILAEMLTGEKIVQIENIYDTVMFQGSESKQIQFPDELSDSQFVPILEKSTAKRLNDRYETAHEMIEDLCELDLPGVGTFEEDIPLETSSHQENEPSRSDRRAQMQTSPPVGDVEPVVEEPDHPRVVDIKDDDPTVERQYSFEVAPATGASHTGSSPQDRPLPEGFEAEFEADTRGNDSTAREPSPRTMTPGARPSSKQSIPDRRPARETPVDNSKRRREDAKSRAEPPASEPMATGMRGPAAEAASAEAMSARRAEEPSTVRDVILGVLIGAVMLALVVAWLHLA